MPTQPRKARCAGSGKHIATVAKIREARQEARKAMNKMRVELKKERPVSCQHFCPGARVRPQTLHVMS